MSERHYYSGAESAYDEADAAVAARHGRREELATIADGLERARFALMLVAAWSRDCDMASERKAVDRAISALATYRERGAH